MAADSLSDIRPSVPPPRKGMPSPKLAEPDFKARYREQFADPNFGVLRDEIESLTEVAWRNYSDARKSPNLQKAGVGFHDPDYDLSVDWMAAFHAIKTAEARYRDPAAKPGLLLVNASSRSEHTCPGEMSKSFRLVEIAREAAEQDGVATTVLDLSRLASEYGRNIHPCKACFSTAPALCHWPCSCYPNHSLGQTHDWMNEIYPLWVEAHGVLIVTPVNWYQVSSPLKLMMDRLVCADGGNPDPTLTAGKDAFKAKELEEGWQYPQHLAGRLYSVIVHGDVEGASSVRRSASDWLRFMGLAPAGPRAEVDRYIGYWEPYSTNHVALDKDSAVQEEVRNAARTLARAILAQSTGTYQMAGSELVDPRNK
jgi:multimeric flavodoxin WrbA